VTPAWAVIWHGRTCVVFLKEIDVWSLDPDEACVFNNLEDANLAADIYGGAEVAMCWT